MSFVAGSEFIGELSQSAHHDLSSIVRRRNFSKLTLTLGSDKWLLSLAGRALVR
jgi:hypothetical protein